MRIFSLPESIQVQNFSVIGSKTVQIKKIMSISDMIALKNKMSTLKMAVKVGSKIFVENHQIKIPKSQK